MSNSKQLVGTKPSYQVHHVQRLLDGGVTLLPKGHVVAEAIPSTVVVVP